jgi:CHAT domain
VGWIANLLDMVGKFVPDNPFISGAEFVSEAIVWLAHHVAGDLPGLRSMDGGGATISDLQAPPAPPDRAYSALVANFQPDQALWQRMIDVGVDQFFGSANDLVVPSEGGWRVDRDGVHHVDASRVGCFGPGGNLAPNEPGSVTHVSFFHRQETGTFLQRALAGEDQKLTKINLDTPLPDRRFIRGGAAMAAAAAGTTETAPAAPRPAGPAASTITQGVVIPSISPKDTMHVVILRVPLKVPSTDADFQPVEYHPDMAQIFASYGGARVVELMPLRTQGTGPDTGWYNIIKIHEQIKNYTDKNIGNIPSDKEMLKYGELLFKMLFRGNVKRLYDTARSLQREDKLTIVFTSMLEWVAAKPWEFAFDPARKSFLATEEIHFVRNVLTQVPGDETQTITGPLRILVVSAQPMGFAQLSIEQETAMVRSGFEELIAQGLADVEVLPRATISALHGYISSGRYNVVHFIGHGTFEEKTGGYLLFEDGRGGSDPLDERSARELFCGRNLSLVFLNACQTGAGSHSDFNRGMAQALVAHGMPALVANQYSVRDTSATSFAQFFYWGLAHGMSLGAAARESRIAVNYQMRGYNIEWAVPVLYARDPNNCLVARSAKNLPFTAAQTTISRRSSTLKHASRIAIWDADHVMSELGDTLDRLNGAQKRFGFETVNLSVPLDAMETVDEGGQRISYLRVDRIAERLTAKLLDLQALYLVCITHLPLSDGKVPNLYAWWPEGRKPPVLILSYHGFESLHSEGILARRALTNVLVMAISGMQANRDTHERGPKNCPLYRNPERSLEVITAQQTFDPECRGYLDPADLAAFEAMLRVFDGTGDGGPATAKVVKAAARPKKKTAKKKARTARK